MRGGPALVGGATTSSLLDRWTPSRVRRPRLFVGEYEGAVVGLLAVDGTPGAGGVTSGRIECCYVETGCPRRGRRHRAHGGGGRLVQATGCAEVDALALPGDRATKQRLEAAGFTARLLTLSRRLD